MKFIPSLTLTLALGALSATTVEAKLKVGDKAPALKVGEWVQGEAVKELSTQRAHSVRQALLDKFKTIPQNQIGADGVGWKAPADPTDPNNHAKNRRVEVKVYPLEAQ